MIFARVGSQFPSSQEAAQFRDRRLTDVDLLRHVGRDEPSNRMPFYTTRLGKRNRALFEHVFRFRKTHVVFPQQVATSLLIGGKTK